MIISFSGIDGSGKTTQALRLVSSLKKRNIKVQYIHIIKWTLMNKIGRKLSRSIHVKTEKKGSNFNRFMSLVIIFRKLVMLTDIFRFYISFNFSANARNKIFIFDRYFYDIGVQAIYNGIMGNRLESIYWKFVPEPTIAILLDISPELAQQREKEHSSEYFQLKRKLYSNRENLWKVKKIHVSTTEETASAITELLPFFEKY